MTITEQATSRVAERPATIVELGSTGNVWREVREARTANDRREATPHPNRPRRSSRSRSRNG